MDNMNTSKSSALERIFSTLQKPFDKSVLDAYLKLKAKFDIAYYSSEYDGAGIAFGKFVEVIIRLVQLEVKGAFTPFGTSISDLSKECRDIIETKGSSASESVRVIIPRSLVFLYTLRNKRGIGHVGGDVDANRVDIKTATQIADWVICELIRIYHHTSLEAAQDIVNGLTEKEIPEVWEIDGKKRILKNGLSSKDKTLLLLYSEVSSFALVEDLYEWIEYSNISLYRQRVLSPLHESRYIEFNKKEDIAFISPLGINYIEALIRTKKATP